MEMSDFCRHFRNELEIMNGNDIPNPEWDFLLLATTIAQKICADLSLDNR